MANTALICWPVEYGPPGIAGSTTGRCSLEGCDRQVWVSPTGRERIEAGVAEIVCHPCGVEKLGLPPVGAGMTAVLAHPMVRRPEPDQLREVAANRLDDSELSS